MLNPVDPDALARLAQRGDQLAAEKLHVAFTPLIASRVSRFRGRMISASDDLRQEGHEALHRAIVSWVPERQVPFAAWAARTVNYAIRDAAYEARTTAGLPIRVPRSAWKSDGRAGRAARDLKAAARVDWASADHPSIGSVEDQVEMRMRITQELTRRANRPARRRRSPSRGSAPTRTR